MKLLHFADVHLTDGPRFDETMAALGRLVDCAHREQPDHILCAGDIFGRTVPHRATPAERNSFAEVCMELAEVARVAIVYGNHDAAGELFLLPRLRSTQPIALCEHPVVTLAGIAACPYPRRENIQPGESVEADRERLSQGLDAVLQGLAHSDGLARPGVLVGHFSVSGASLGGGEVMLGREIEADPHILDSLGFAYIALGHIHEPQQISERAWYSGSLIQQNFGESERKGWNLVEIEANGKVRVDFVESGARRLVTVETSWDGRELGAMLTSGETAGAEVRVLVDVPEEHLASLPDIGSRISRAYSVIVKPRVVPATRRRCAEITEARTVRDKFLTWCGSQQPEPDADLQQAAADRIDSL